MKALVLAWSILGFPLNRAPQDPLVGHWKLDGDALDAGPGSHPGRLVGRTEFLDSPIGRSGQMLALNGVDAYLEIPLPAEAWAGDFTLSWWVFPLEPRRAVLASRGWSIELGEDGTLQWGSRKGILGSSFAPGRWIHLALAVRREGGKEEAVLFENAQPFALPDLGPVDRQVPLTLGGAGPGSKFLSGLLDDVRLYRRALGAPEVAELTDAGLADIRPKPHAGTPFPGGKFTLEPRDVVAFLGGENTLAAQSLGYLETLLTLRPDSRRAHYRALAWEGDTALEQWRVLNFGSWPQHLERTGASVLLVGYGQIEALGGKAALEAFVQAYEKLLVPLGAATRRVVLLSPFPFEKPPPPLPDLSMRNPEARAYAAAIRKLAEKNGFLYVDLFTPLEGASGLTRDGLHLTTRGQWIVAREICRQLGMGGEFPAPDPAGAFVQEPWERLRQEVCAKNRLWASYWRPTNWAFLAGDRTEQPSSRDHLDHRVRWFPIEVQKAQALIGRAEDRIESRAASLRRP
jgi:hypothetical protein